MASNQADTPDESNESKGGSKLDNLSRDDLVKFVKKQMVLLQKNKTHSDEISRELAETKEKLNKQTEVKAERKQDDEDANEKENLIQAYNASQTALEESASKIAGLTEQVNCLQQKNETLTSLFQCMQTELDTTTSRNKELENSLLLMSDARDEAVKQLDVRHTSAGPSAADADQFVCSKCGEMRMKVDEMTVILEELRQKIEPVETDRNRLKLDLGQSQEKLAKAVAIIDKLKKERQQTKEQIAEMQSSQSMLPDLQEALDTVRQEQLATSEEQLRVLVELGKAKTDLAKSFGDYENVVSEKAELVSQMANLQKAFDSVERQCKDVQNDRDVCAERLAISQRNLDDIAQQLSRSEEEKNRVLTDSIELQKSFDSVVERLEAVTNEKQAAHRKLEDLKVDLAESEQIAREGKVNAKKLRYVEELLRKMQEELAATKTDLESEKMRNRDLEERVSHLDKTRNERVEPVPQPSGEEAGGPDEDTARDDLVRGLHLEIDQLKMELQRRTTEEQEVVAVNEELRNQVEELKSSLGKSFDENKNVETDASSDDAWKRTVEKQPSTEAGEWMPISAQTSLSEGDAQPQEVLLLREKLVEWETMMQMLQTERDDMEREIVRMGEREKRDGCLLEEILLALQNALKGRDLFHDQTKTMEDNGAIYAKLSILQSIVDETNFERDEMKEKIQHLTEQVVDLEKRLLETAGSGDTSSMNSISKEGFSDELNDAGGVSQMQLRTEQLLENGSENLVIGQDKKVEDLSREEVALWKQMLEVERKNSEKWKSDFDDVRRTVEGLMAEKEQLEKTLQEALRATSHVQLDREQHSQREEKNKHDGEMVEVVYSGDDQTRRCEEEARVDSEASEGTKEDLLMTEQVKQTTVKRNRPLVIQVQLEDEKLRLSEENRSLREEIQLLRSQLETMVDHSAEITRPRAVQPCVDDISHCEEDGISEASHAERDIADSSQTCVDGEMVGDAAAGLDGLRKEIKDAECLLQEKRDELSRLAEEIDSAEKRSECEAELERLRVECGQAKAEFEVLLQNKNFEFEGLQAELLRASEELGKNEDHEVVMVTLREELNQLKKEREDFSEQKQMLISQLTAAQKDVETISNEKDIEIQRLKEEHGRLRKDAEERSEEYKTQLQLVVKESGQSLSWDFEQMSLKDAEIRRLMEEQHKFKEDADARVEEYQSQLQLAVKESSQNLSWDYDQMSLKDAEIRGLEDTLAKLREEMESRIRHKDDEINALKEKDIGISEETPRQSTSEDVDGALAVAREEAQNHLKEIFLLRSELSRIQDETGETLAKADSESEELKAELAKVKASADVRESELDKTAEGLRRELYNMMQELDEKNQMIRVLEEEVLNAKQRAEHEEKEKATQVANLEDLVEQLRKEAMDEKIATIKELEEQLQQNLEGQVRVKDVEIENMRIELVAVREQLEVRVRDRDDEIERLKTELASVKEEIEKNDENKVSEVERLTAEVERLTAEVERLKAEIETLTAECSEGRVEQENNVKVRDSEIENLKLEIIKIKAEFEDRWKNSGLEYQNAMAEPAAGNDSAENLIRTKDQQIVHLQEELLKLMDIEGQLEDTKGQLKDVEGQLEDTKGQLKDVEGQLEDTKGQLKDVEGQLEDTKGQLKDVESQLEAKLSANAKLDTELVRLREHNEDLIKQNADEINSLKDDIAKSRKETEDLVLSKDSEIQKLLAEVDFIREESGRMRASSDTKIEDLEKRLEAFQNEAQNAEGLNLELQELRAERERMRLIIDTRESEIEQLREEVSRGKNLMESSFERKENEQVDVSGGSMESSPNQTTSSPSSSGETVAMLELRLKEREERENKLKQLTLKAKKESADLRAKLTACQKELDVASAKLLEASSHNESNQSIQFQSLQTEYDKLESLFEAEKSARLELQKSLKQAVDELSNVKVSAAELTEEKSKMKWDLQRLEREKKELETLRAEKEQEVQAERIQREQLARDKSELEKRATKAESQVKDTEDELKMEIRQLQDQLKAAKHELDYAKTEIQQTNMMDLEIADYERAVKTLHETVADRDAKLKALQEELEQQQEQRAALQKLLDSSGSQYSQLDDHCSKLKQLLVKSKKDLAEAKKLEGEQRTLDAQMRGQLERLTQLTEEQKLQISSLVAENQKQAEKLRLHSDSHQRTAQSLEQRVQSLEHDLQVSRSEMAAIQAEYDGYKVRVHSVLKTQKTRSSAGDDVTVEQERFERQQMEKSVEVLKTRLADVSQQMASISSEYDLLQEEHDRLQARHSKLIAEMEANERGWRDRLEKVNTESSMNSMKKVEVIQQLTVQSEIISSSYKDQIQSMNEEHQRVVDSLREQLEMAEIELDRYHARFQNMSNQQNLPSNSIVSLPALEHETSSSDRVMEFVKELRPEERQSGEGSETVDDIHVKMSSAANHSLLPFDQLLDSTQMDDVMSVKTMESTAEEMMLRANLTSSEKRIEHLTQILNESEATVLRLTEQASILKGEIRRMERNQERETAISNMEYLKNVVYKFMTLKSGDERLQLIPVLTTMLKFSPDEKDKMTAIAAGTEGVPPAGQDAAGWGTYLHRWSGLV